MIPQILYSTRLVLLTPCFCAGAEQAQPELRATSFRGELRWWFRCLGGTRAQEQHVFGGISGSAAHCSSVSLRVTKIKQRQGYEWSYERSATQNSQKNSSYITFPLTMNRERSDAYLAPGTSFTLELTLRNPIADAVDRELLKLSWECLCSLGSIGLRSTRALGAYSPENPAERRAEELLANPTFVKAFSKSIILSKDYGDYRQPSTTRALLTEAARRLSSYREQSGWHAVSSRNSSHHYCGPSVFGNAMGAKNSKETIETWRQRSALRFRPILTAEDALKLCILKAPDSTLSKDALKHNINGL